MRPSRGEVHVPRRRQADTRVRLHHGGDRQPRSTLPVRSGLLSRMDVCENLSPIPKPAPLLDLVDGNSYPVLGHEGNLTVGSRFSTPNE